MKTIVSIYPVGVAIILSLIILGCGKEPKPEPEPSKRDFSFVIDNEVSVVGSSDAPSVEQAKIDAIIRTTQD